MALYKRDHLSKDWNKLMAQFFREGRSLESSSGVVSDHCLSNSEHSESTRSLSNHAFSPNKTNPLDQSNTHQTFSSNRHPIESLIPTSKNDNNFPIYANISCVKVTENRGYRLKSKIKPILQNKYTSSSSAKFISFFDDKRSRRKDASFTTFSDLNDGLLTRIFQQLASNELCKCAMVCKRWYEIVWNPCLWSYVFINNQNLDVNKGIKCLTTALCYDEFKACLIIEGIDLTGCHKLTDETLYLIAKRCPKLKELILDGCQEVTNIAIYEIVSRCIDLESLSLSGCLYVTCISLTPEANLQATTYCKQIYLNHLDMTDCINVDDSSLQMVVTYCSNLSFLYLRRCVKITDVGVQYAASYCNKLQELSVSDCPNISDLGMTDISRMESNLRYLSIAKCRRISDAGLKCVAKRCTKLRYLNIRGCDKITEDGIKYLAGYCNKLKSLDLGNCGAGINDQVLRALAKCNQLRRLSLKGCSQITDDGVISLTQYCNQLQHVNLIDCNISSRALEFVHRNCPSCIVAHNNPGIF